MKYIDPDIARKNRLLDENMKQHSGQGMFPVFSVLEFNLCGLCTRKCVFCPHSSPNYSRTDAFISVKLFAKVMDDIQKIDYDGTIIFSAFCEPLLHKQVEKLVELARKGCPNARVEIVTNGDLATADKIANLFAAGLSTLCVSLYDGPHQIDYFKALQEQLGLKGEQLVLRPRWLSAREHYGITLTNRAGAIEIKDAGITTPDEPIKKPCYYPFFQTLIDYDGSVLLCTHNWSKKIIAGNVNEESILDIWNNEPLKKIRLELANSNRNFVPCNLCNTEGMLMGRGHFDRWVNYYEKQ